jgi:hypothetical protein
MGEEGTREENGEGEEEEEEAMRERRLGYKLTEE